MILLVTIETVKCLQVKISRFGVSWLKFRSRSKVKRDQREQEARSEKNCNVEPDHVPAEQGGPADGLRGGKRALRDD